ncbi:MAG: hypothetical protein P8X98_11340, partial [Woeseiaceae bacterium]
MASLLAELKRRNVLRSAALYLAASWLILQVADLVLDAFDASPAVMRNLIVAFAIGFPVFLLLSWFYELRGARLVRDAGEPAEDLQGSAAGLANAVIVILIVLSAGIYFYSQLQTPEGPGRSDPSRAAAVDAGTTIAVLPLANISKDPDDEYLADGLTEELLNALTSVPQLRVTARASSFALKGAELDARSIGERLGVDHVIEGSVRKVDDKLRISVQLVDTDTGRSLWSSTYDRNLTDVFDIQKDIAERVSGTLQLSLFSDPDPVIRRTEPEAYAAYLRALNL